MHICITSFSHPYPLGHCAHTLSDFPSSQGFTSICPASHPPLHSVHVVIPTPAHSTPSRHFVLILPSMHASPASHGQHIALMLSDDEHSRTVYSPGGHGVHIRLSVCISKPAAAPMVALKLVITRSMRADLSSAQTNSSQWVLLCACFNATNTRLVEFAKPYFAQDTRRSAHSTSGKPETDWRSVNVELCG